MRHNLSPELGGQPAKPRRVCEFQASYRQTGAETGMLLTNPDIVGWVVEGVLSGDRVHFVIPEFRSSGGVSIPGSSSPLHAEVTSGHHHCLPELLCFCSAPGESLQGW